jgi:hypothetical protein
MLVMLNMVFASFDDSDGEPYSRAYAADKNDISDISDDDEDNKTCKAPKATKRKTHRRETVGNPKEEAHIRSPSSTNNITFSVKWGSEDANK